MRGVANDGLAPEIAFALGRAAAAVLAESSDRHRPIIVGRDTRISGTMLEAALTAGMTSIGRDVVSIGIVPTPAVAVVTVAEEAAAGAMISASHNPIEDNGIKFFGSDGFKLSDAIEDRIEEAISARDLPRPTGTGIGQARVSQNLGKHYYQRLFAAVDDLRGVDIVVDGANGAAYAVAPYALRTLGATVHEINCANDGSRINVGCGATDLRTLQAAVRERHAAGAQHALGVAYDGDADRALFIDESGAIVTGDHVLFALGRAFHESGQLPHDALVATVMTNIGTERALAHHGITLHRAAVGDRYVLEMMRETGCMLGGEQSGHVIDLHRNTTGDGPMTTMTLLGILKSSGATLHELVREVVFAPQVLVNVRVADKRVMEAPAVRAALERAQSALDGSGRILLRPSGTEPLIRVMVEGDDRATIERIAGAVAAAVEGTTV